MVVRLTGLGAPRSEMCVRRAGSGLADSRVDGLEGSGTAGYADLPVVHSERKFQSHPAVPPERLIVLAYFNAYSAYSFAYLFAYLSRIYCVFIAYSAYFAYFSAYSAYFLHSSTRSQSLSKMLR